jgi:hypothetical protein
LDFAKTASRFTKKRRTFNKFARFVSYDFGNVKCYVCNVIDYHNENNIENISEITPEIHTMTLHPNPNPSPPVSPLTLPEPAIPTNTEK